MPTPLHIISIFDPATNKTRVAQFRAGNRLIREGSLMEFPRALIVANHAQKIEGLYRVLLKSGNGKRSAAFLIKS